MKDDSASYYESKEFRELLSEFEKMVENGEESNHYYDSVDIADIAEYYNLSGEFDKATATIDYGLVLHPDSTEILIAKASNLLQRGQRCEARVIAESLDSRDNQELQYLLGEIDLYDEFPDTANEHFERAVQLSNEDPGMINDIIVRLMDNRQYELAQNWLTRAQTISPDSRNFIELQADLYFDTGSSDVAIEWYNRLLDDFPYDTYYWEQLGRIYYEQADYQKSCECFEFIEAIDSGNRSAQMMRAGCLVQLGLWEAALPLYENMHADDPESPAILYYCGRCHFETGSSERAQEYLMQGLPYLDSDEFQDMLVEYYLLLAKVYSSLDNTDEARMYIHLALSIENADPEINRFASLLLSADEIVQITGRSQESDEQENDF